MCYPLDKCDKTLHLILICGHLLSVQVCYYAVRMEFNLSECLLNRFVLKKLKVLYLLVTSHFFNSA